MAERNHDLPKIPTIPEKWESCSVIIKSTTVTVWEDHKAAGEGAAAGITIDVLSYPDGGQKLTMLPTERYDRKKFAELLKSIAREALNVDVNFS